MQEQLQALQRQMQAIQLMLTDKNQLAGSASTMNDTKHEVQSNSLASVSNFSPINMSSSFTQSPNTTNSF